jgi:hypothetical protein
MSTVTIGCRLPSGIILDIGPEHPMVELAGKRQAQEGSPIVILREADCGYTQVDASYWEAFKKRVGPDFAPLKSGAIFEAKSIKEAKAVNKDLKGKKTGHEPLSQEAKDIQPMSQD